MTKWQMFLAFLLLTQTILGLTAITTMVVDYFIIAKTDYIPNFYWEFFGFFVFYTVLLMGTLAFVNTYSEEKE